MSKASKKDTVDKYFGFIKKLDIETKKILIAKLTESLEGKNDKVIDLAKLYGAWEDSRSSEDIIKDINTRHFEGRASGKIDDSKARK